MKKSICILLTAVACLLCLAGPAAADVIEFSECGFVDVAAIDDTLYIRTKLGGVYTWKPGDKELTLYESGYDARYYRGFAAIDGILYTIDKENYQFTGIGENGRGAPLDGAAIPDFEKTANLGEGWQIYCMRNTPYGLFWVTYPNYHKNTLLLCRLDLSTMKLSCRPVPNIYSYCVQEEGTIWIVQNAGEEYPLSVLDWDSGKLAKVDDLPMAAGGMIMKDGDMYFNVKEGQIIRRAPDGNIEEIGQVSIHHGNHFNSILMNDDVLVYVRGNKLTAFSLSEAKEQ